MLSRIVLVAACTAAIFPAGTALAGFIFEPVTSNVIGSPGGTVQVPWQVRLTLPDTEASYSYAAFNFTSTAPDVAQVIDFTWESAIGGSQGPVTFSHFWDPMLEQDSETLIFGVLTLQLGISGEATITSFQGSGPQWLWTGDCPEVVSHGSLSVLVPSPGTAIILGPLAFGFIRRRA